MRKQNESQLDTLISEWTIKHTSEEVEAYLQEVEIPCHAVSTIKDVIDDSQVKHRGYLRQLKHSVMGDHTYHTLGFNLSKGHSTWQAGPALGEHNEYVFENMLGMTDEEISEALISGCITTDADLPF